MLQRHEALKLSTAIFIILLNKSDHLLLFFFFYPLEIKCGEYAQTLSDLKFPSYIHILLMFILRAGSKEKRGFSGKTTLVLSQLFNQKKCSPFFNWFSNYCLFGTKKMHVRHFKLDVLLLHVYCGNRFVYLRQMVFTLFLLCNAFKAESITFCQQY